MANFPKSLGRCGQVNFGVHLVHSFEFEVSGKARLNISNLQSSIIQIENLVVDVVGKVAIYDTWAIYSHKTIPIMRSNDEDLRTFIPPTPPPSPSAPPSNPHWPRPCSKNSCGIRAFRACWLRAAACCRGTGFRCRWPESPIRHRMLLCERWQAGNIK